MSLEPERPNKPFEQTALLSRPRQQVFSTIGTRGQSRRRASDCKPSRIQTPRGDFALRLSVGKQFIAATRTSRLFFKNGLISCQGEFDNGKKSGKWKYFLNNGQMQSSGSFKDGKIVGRWKWFFKTGEPRGTGGFDDEEQKHGAWKRYHANGQLWDEGRFEHGKKRGTWKVHGWR